MRETASRHEAEGSSLIFTASRNKPCCICFTIPHKYFCLETDLEQKTIRVQGIGRCLPVGKHISKLCLCRARHKLHSHDETMYFRV